MAQEDQSETSPQSAKDAEEEGSENQASPSVIEIHDSMTECEDEERPDVLQMEEKVFVSSLHSFMKDRGTPIERIPHLGFKQINLWSIYKAVGRLGGYDSVTSRRLWKKVYDELGGSPGSTSAATCTRRHYEKLVLPFERHVKGEEDKPLPPSKPRKPYKRNLVGKVPKAEKKRKRVELDREMDSEMDSERLTQRSPEATCQTEAGIHRLHSDRSQTNMAATNVLCTSVYARLVQVPAVSGPWTAHISPSTTGEVISPLEKKKRMAQASLNLLQSLQSEDKDRPSVIHRSQSPAGTSTGQNHNSSEGSPVPLSSSSSRSPSPFSVSSEDSHAGNEDQPASGSELTQNSSRSVRNITNRSEESKSVNCSQNCKDASGLSKDVCHVNSHSVDSTKVQVKDSTWEPIEKGKYLTHPFLSSSSSYTGKSNWAPTSRSSFTKVVPKTVQLLRPAPIRPSGYKVLQGRPVQQDNSVTFAKNMNNTTIPWLYQTEKRDKSRTMLQKVSPSQQSLSHPILPSYDKSGRDSRHQASLHHAFFANRTRLPQPQLMYRHLPVGPAPSALIGSEVYPYPYSIPLLMPQGAYLPAINPMYHSKR